MAEPSLPADPARTGRMLRLQTRLDDYVDRYAERTQAMKASEIRALFAVASRPEVVSLAGGMPNISGLPLDAVAETLGDLVATTARTAMQYGSGQGDPVLREQICTVMALEGIKAHPDDVVVTVGSQQAVDLVTRVFCDPGDVVHLRGAQLRRRARRVQRLPVRRRARRDGRARAWSPRRSSRRSPRSRPPASD